MASESIIERQAMADEDVQLMLKAKDGDSGAFEQLFERYVKRLVSFAYGIIHNRWRAEELVQDAFLQVYRARKRYCPKARFSTYIYRVVTNNCLNEIRRNGHEKTVPDEARPMAEDHTPGPEHQVKDREIVSHVQAAIEGLPPKQRAALLLSRVEGLDHRQVAQCLEVSEYSVKSLVFRATRTLREQLEATESPNPARARRARSRTRTSSAAAFARLGFAWQTPQPRAAARS
jgi:RNA polymerase sigma-70 factor (ECF subfamily)